MSGVTRVAPLDRLMRPVHQWVWSGTDRRVRKLLTFAEVETDGGRDILRALVLRDVDRSVSLYRTLADRSAPDPGAWLDLGRAQEAAGLRTAAPRCGAGATERATSS